MALGAALRWCAVTAASVTLCGFPLLAVAESAPDADDMLHTTISASLLSDYIYRGVSLSGRHPSVATYVEFEWHQFSFVTNVQSVDLPTHPAAEITFTGGYKWECMSFQCEANASYFYYPGEIPTNGVTSTSYWEYSLGITHDFSNQDFGGLALKGLTLDGLVAYSPNVSNSGAWGAYVEGGATYRLGRLDVLSGVDWSFVATAGYWRFGNMAPSLGGFPLPAYANWQLGVVFQFSQNLNLTLSYSDTSLSREDCFVFTGDLLATPGGVANPVSNPDGLRSRLCGAAFVATLAASLDFPRAK